MIPLRDDARRAAFPFVTYALIAANLSAFLWELRLGNEVDGAIRTWGLVPARVLDASADPLARFLPLLTSMFLHGGLLHLGGNLVYLHIFGDNVEGRLGAARYVLFYLFCGGAAAAFQIAMSPASQVPVIGASGAIAGITGAYFVFFPGAHVLTLVPIFFFVRVVRIPAVAFLFLWFVLQLVYGAASVGDPDAAGVAWWAHVGGFLGGMIGAVLLAPTRSNGRRG